jgi:hypothetical protein
MNDDVILGLRALHIEFVLEAGTAAAFDADPQHRALRLLFEDIADPSRRPFRDCDAARIHRILFIRSIPERTRLPRVLPDS